MTAGTVIAVATPTLLLLGGSIYRALPAKAADMNWPQFILDVVRGVLGALPTNAPKLTPAQKAATLAGR
jgi:hypothetical protein